MFYFGIKTRFLMRTDNPFAGVSLYPENERDRVLSDKEAGKLLSELESIPATHSKERTLRDFVLLSLATSAPKSNVLSMRWGELDLHAGAWSIPAEKTETLRAQIIPLGPIEIGVLTERSNCSGNWRKLMMIARGSSLGKVRWVTLSIRVTPVSRCASLGMSDLWIHDLRRSLASTMANTGADVSVVRAALNHTDMRTSLKAYIRASQQVQLQARQKAQEAWLEAMKR